MSQELSQIKQLLKSRKQRQNHPQLKLTAFLTACRTDNSTELTKALFEYNNYEGFREACTHGSINMLKSMHKIFSKINKPNKPTPQRCCGKLPKPDACGFRNNTDYGLPLFECAFKHNDYEALCNAIKNSHIDILNYFNTTFTSIIINNAFKNQYYKCFYTACIHNCMEVLIWMDDNFPYEMEAAFGSKKFKAFRTSCKNGHIDVIIWMEETFEDMIDAAFNSYQCYGYKQAIKNNDKTMIKWMNKTFVEFIKRIE